MNKPISEAIPDLLKEGGALVPSSECHPLEIADAQATERFYADCLGLGVVHRTQVWLDHVTKLNRANTLKEVFDEGRRESIKNS